MSTNGRRHDDAARNRTATLDYIQGMLGQLRTMADADRHDMLAYLIEMAYVEAGDIMRGQRPARMENRDKANAS